MTVKGFLDQQSRVVEKYLEFPNGKGIIDLFLPIERKPISLGTRNLLFDIFEHLSLFKVGAIGLVFLEEVIETEKYYIFAGCDTDVVCIDKLTNEVKYVSEDNVELYYVAKSVEDYLKVFGILSEHDIKGYFGYKYNQSDRDIVLEKCKDIVCDSKYFEFYKRTFIPY